jgi:hypothetical protein
MDPGKTCKEKSQDKSIDRNERRKLKTPDLLLLKSYWFNQCQVSSRTLQPNIHYSKPHFVFHYKTNGVIGNLKQTESKTNGEK